MKITQALKTAQAHVYPIRHGRQWVVTSPWRGLTGPTTHTYPADYSKARRSAAAIRAGLAVELMGGNADDRNAAMVLVEYVGDDWRDAVRNITRKRAQFTIEE